MATRTQKAAKRQKAEDAKAAKADKAHAKAHAEAQQAVAKPKGKPAKKAAAKKAAKPKAAPTQAPATQEFEPFPEPTRTSFAERFWHRIGLRAQKREQEAHQREAELEFQEEQARIAREAAEAARRKEEAAEERRKAARSARELKQAAEEEAKRQKEEAAAEARRKKEEAAAEAQRQKEAEAQAKEVAKAERAERARAAREAKREAARLAQEEAEREAEERRMREAHEREVAAAEAAAEAERKEAERAAKAARKKAPEPEPAEEPEAEEAEPEPEPEPAKPVEVKLKPKPAPEPEDEEEPAPPKPATRPPPADQLEEHADRLAAELAARRSKPITIEVEDEAVPMLPVGKGAKKDEEPKEVLQLDPAPPARVPDAPQIRGLSIPEHFLLLAMEDGWDERTEKAKPGHLGGGLTGALVLELVLHGAVKVQRDRFVLQDADLDDATEAVAAKLQQFAQLPSLRAMAELAKWLPQLLPAYKDRMARRGLIEHKAWRHLGLAYRSQTALLDPDAQERLRNKLARAIAGGGRPDAPTILSLGLLEASGLFGLVVPEGAQAYNRKRLNGLLGGKDVMGYKVDDQLKGIQEMAVRTVLDNVRVMTAKG